MARVSKARSRIVFRAIKAAILKGEDVEYWALRMYEQQDAGVLDADQVAQLEELIEAYYDAQEEPTDEATDEPTDVTAE